MGRQKLSVIVPCYNEEKTLRIIVEKILEADVLGLDLEVLIIDDASRDQSLEISEKLIREYDNVKLIQHQLNQGKGAAIANGIGLAKGDIFLIQDADLEYDPSEYPDLLKPILDGYADVVYGSRFSGGKGHRVLYFWHSIGNRVLTLVSNMLTGFNLTDMETCYKVFKRDIIEQLNLCEKRFGIEPEITAKISRLNPRPRVYEVGISYNGRTYSEGKKITWRDGFRAIYCILRYNLLP
jgi:glycosyltransferase involved in cell wall biosynthesis